MKISFSWRGRDVDVEAGIIGDKRIEAFAPLKLPMGADLSVIIHLTNGMILETKGKVVGERENLAGVAGANYEIKVDELPDIALVYTNSSEELDNADPNLDDIEQAVDQLSEVSSAPGVELRKSVRVEVDPLAGVIGQVKRSNGVAVPVTIMNISVGGALFSSDEVLEPSERIEFNVAYKQLQLLCFAKVVRFGNLKQPFGGRNQAAAIQFMDTTPNVQEVAKQLVGVLEILQQKTSASELNEAMKLFGVDQPEDVAAVLSQLKWQEKLYPCATPFETAQSAEQTDLGNLVRRALVLCIQNRVWIDLIQYIRTRPDDHRVWMDRLVLNEGYIARVEQSLEEGLQAANAADDNEARIGLIHLSNRIFESKKVLYFKIVSHLASHPTFAEKAPVRAAVKELTAMQALQGVSSDTSTVIYERKDKADTTKPVAPEPSVKKGKQPKNQWLVASSVLGVGALLSAYFLMPSIVSMSSLGLKEVEACVKARILEGGESLIVTCEKQAWSSMSKANQEQVLSNLEKYMDENRIPRAKVVDTQANPIIGLNRYGAKAGSNKSEFIRRSY